MRQKINDLKKATILEIAHEAFKTNGYESTAISTIAKEAGCSIGTIYGFFENKEGVFQAVHTMKMQEALEMLTTLFAQNPKVPAENLKATLRFYFTTIEEHKISVQEMLLSLPSKIGCPMADADPHIAMYELMATEIEKLNVEHTLKGDDYLQYAFNMRNLAASYIERWALLGDIELSTKVDECLEIFLGGIIK